MPDPDAEFMKHTPAKHWIYFEDTAIDDVSTTDAMASARAWPEPLQHGNAWILVSAFGGRAYGELSYTLDRDDHVLLIGRLLSQCHQRLILG
jgi:hypothetical protein